jgi:hypothetical protein
LRKITALTIAWLLPTILAGLVTSLAGVQDKGMTELFELDELTLIYPASPMREAVESRLSAERKAEFLTRFKGVPTTVLSDAEVKRSDLGGNLFLLGWDNQVLNRFHLETPFGRSSVSVRFLDYVDERADLDLAFLVDSPFAGPEADSKLFFWSRIDREQDRFMILPFTGSDWALYEDFLVVAQGFLEDASSWPIKRKPNAEMLVFDELVEFRRIARSYKEGNFVLHWDPAVISDPQVQAIAASRQSALAKAIELTGGTAEDLVIELYLYPDADTKLALTGIRAGAHEIGHRSQLHSTVRYAASNSCHEEIHILARRLLGVTSSTAAYEGISFSYEPVISGQPLAFHVALMIDAGTAPSIATLLDASEFTTIGKQEAYAASGLFITWLREKNGLDKLRPWYSSPRSDLPGLASHLGVTPQQAEQDYRAWLEKKTAPFSGDVAFVNAQREAQRHHENGDFAGVASTLRKAVQHRPSDWQTRFNLAAATIRLNEFEATEKQLRIILGSDLPADHTLIVFSHLQLGRLFDLTGKRAEAITEYQKMLTLPDIHDSHITAREGLETAFTKDQLQ